MDILPIKIYGSPVLRETAREIEKIDDQIISLISRMRDSLYYHQGLGLAASQVGEAIRLFLIGDKSGLKTFINPRILKREGTNVAEEGCLSLPGIFVDVYRAESLLLEYIDEKGETRRLEAQGLLARAIQHEFDHLEGTLISDRAGYISRKMIKRKLDKLAKRVRESL